MKVFSPIKTCVHKCYIKVHTSKHLSDVFLGDSGLKRRHLIAAASQLCFRIFHWEGSRYPRATVIEWKPSSCGLS
jgi:hypothetical protein